MLQLSLFHSHRCWGSMQCWGCVLCVCSHPSHVTAQPKCNLKCDLWAYGCCSVLSGCRSVGLGPPGWDLPFPPPSLSKGGSGSFGVPPRSPPVLCSRSSPPFCPHALLSELFALLTFPQLAAILPASKGLLITLMRSGETKLFCDLTRGGGSWEGGEISARTSADA